METRELTPLELDDLLELYRHMHARDEPLPDRETVQSVWREIQKNPCCYCFGTFAYGALVSSCTMTVVPNLSRGCRPYALVENVVTHADYRSRGHAQAVLRHALAVAFEKRCYKVMLLTSRKSEAVYHLYESVGFDRNAKQAFLA